MNPTSQHYHLKDADHQPFRVHMTVPDTPSSPLCCVFLHSGHMTAFDAPARENEFFSALQRNLAALGIATLDFDLPDKMQADEIACATDIQKRYERFNQVIQAPLFEPFKRNYCVIGLSLGGQILLKLLEDSNHAHAHCRQVFLLSTVVEQPVYVYANPDAIHLIYGSRDCIAYCDETTETVEQVCSPDTYSKDSADYVVTRKSQEKHIHILQGVGHLMDMQTTDNPPCDPADYLAALIAGESKSPCTASVEANHANH
ncbi:MULTISPECIES: hypothetical protein [Photorhabdus]|uniref:Alpha/beta hydrolase n=3 Tax=Photorhabdus TaxID=29487 RepID=A0ABX0B400_9GAMM|nr:MULTISPECIES: hypothetical protein [Photorhabdus]AKH64379.1 hypothetical protein VY86_14675 [Photorhabdus thracensis]MCC8375802.1 hypothetical protein [Photorhabdus bodei]MCC8422609.1 hypothetical protein [Photorhabdus thracensis]MCC8465051.1 hypothetical protein [Photorhabdus bodei]MCT8351769.1 hypothetical protein [Photorhabdus kayaii]